MHLEVLVEDSSGAKLIESLIPKIIGAMGAPHTWRVHPYRGIGRLPLGLQPGTDPAKRQLLDQLPKLLSGYGKTPGIDAVVVVVDTDRRECKAFLGELQALHGRCPTPPRTLFRLAIEEIEAWYFGDRSALLAAYPKAKTRVLDDYEQDSVCDTWERLADAVHPIGSSYFKRPDASPSGDAKHEWAERIGALLNVDSNLSPSFCKFRDGLRRLVQQGQ